MFGVVVILVKFMPFRGPQLIDLEFFFQVLEVSFVVEKPHSLLLNSN